MPNSIQQLLTHASHRIGLISETAQLDAEILLCHCLKKNRSFLRAWPDKVISDNETHEFDELIQQRVFGTPIAYLTGTREFWSRNFAVTPDVLIPRPDSELLIELALAYLPTDQTCQIIDLGTGSGILAITLAAERPLAKVIATDICPHALAIAKKNAEWHSIANIEFRQSDWFAQVDDQLFDLIISNPPYIAENDEHLQSGDLLFEPILALTCPENGLQAIKTICQQSQVYLKDNGLLLIEHGYNQKNEVQSIFSNALYQQIKTHSDLSGQPRVTSGLRTSI